MVYITISVSIWYLIILISTHISDTIQIKKAIFGKYGGVYIDDKLKAAMAEISQAYFTICQSRKFIAELRRIRKEFQGRPTPVSHLERLSDAMGGRVQLYAKREDLNHSGAHKLNHCMGEALLAKYMGKKKVIAKFNIIIFHC